MAKSIHLWIAGITGKMGGHVYDLALKDANFQVVAGVGRGPQTGGGSLKVFEQYPKKTDGPADLLVDFSLPELFSQTLEFCVENKIALVSGTTGLQESDFKKLEEAAKSIAVLWAPNMSLGIQFMKSMIKHFKALKGFDFQLEEFHHRHKKDRPSGTAIFLQQELQKEVDAKAPEPLVGRGGGIYGVHKLFAMSEEEVITFEHQALNRQVFAKGALTAGQWIVGQKPGRYSMEQVLCL